MTKTVLTKMVVGLLTVSLFSFGCTGEISQTPDVENRPLGLTLERGLNSMSGQFIIENTAITFDSVLVKENLVELEMTINDKEFLWHTDFAKKALYINGGSAILSLKEKQALQNMADELYKQTQANKWNKRQDTFAGTAAVYWADAPTGYVHGERTISNAQVYSLESDDTIGKSNVCVKTGDVHTVIYDMGDGGAVKYDTVEVMSDWGTSVCGEADYSCMGRCGGGCGGFGGGITLDCLEHDVCSHNECASGGGSDENCGDEYDDAADDIALFGGHRCDGTFSEFIEPGCGNSVLEAGETCDSDTVNCADLDPVAYGSGTATCNSNCASYDVSACEAPTSGGGGSLPAAIPDNDSTGLTDNISKGTISDTLNSVDITVDITHTYIGDLTVTITSPEGTVVNLWNKSGGGDDDLHLSVNHTEFAGENPAGNWALKVTDTAGADTGTLDAWTVTLNTSSAPSAVCGNTVIEDGETCDSNTVTCVSLNPDDYESGNAPCASNCLSYDVSACSAPAGGGGSLPMAIPDNDSTGITNIISKGSISGDLSSVDITLDITHTYQGDLTVTITSPEGTTVNLWNKSGGGTDDLHLNLNKTEFAFENPAGDWALKVTDTAGSDTGTLDAWSVSFNTSAPAVCGNSIVEGGEDCDDSTQCCASSCLFETSGTSCTGGSCDGAGTCAPDPVCGNGTVEAGEDCDDSSDCCASDCSFVADGITCDGGECNGSGSCESTGGW